MKKKKKIKIDFFWVFLWLGLLIILIYSRFLNLIWGFPFWMNPDERNIAWSIQNLKCDLSNLSQCGNPHFFAYGQFPIYMGYLVVLLIKFFDGDLGTITSSQEAVLSLRIISALTSVINALIIIKILKTLKKINQFNLIFLFLIVIFSPFFIQFSHFGTTESLLMLFYSMIIYLSLQFVEESENLSNILKKIFGLGLISGLSVATKISSFIFLLVPLIMIIFFQKSKLRTKFRLLFFYIIFSLFFGLIFSPYNILNFNDFISSLTYEKGVADGSILVFYNRQFLFSRPIIFQFLKIYPYALGLMNFILFILGFFLTSWKDKKYLFLRLAFLIYFLPSSFLFVKWTRFQAPILPLALIFTLLFLDNIKKKIIFFLIILGCLLPGVAYLSVYKNDDVRIAASNWIFENLPNGAKILSETANVVDVPFVALTKKNINKSFNLISFNFYDLDSSYQLQLDLNYHLNTADYILIPSRRIIYNYTCLKNENDFAYFSNRCAFLKKKYPQLENYYRKILYNKDRFQLIKTFTSYPKIVLFGKKLIAIPDEEAEETWSVFDHPVIRIYKIIK